MSFYLNPTKPALPIPEACMQFMQETLQQRSRSFSQIFQITLENLPQGIVGIYTNNDGRYYRVSKERVMEVNNSFRENTDAESVKITKLNALIAEILSQPDQFQLQVHAPSATASMEAIRRTFVQAMDASGIAFQELLECHPRAPGMAFYVGVGKFRA